MGTLFYGGTIYTMKQEGEMIEAVYTEGQLIVDYGDKQTLEKKYRSNITDQVHLKGAAMLPGFVDSHMHLIGHGERLLRLDLSACISKEAALQLIKKAGKKATAGEWILGGGWNENIWDDKSPLTKEELDKAIPNNPVVLDRICKHAIAVNSKALQLANVTNKTEEPFGGVIERDETGAITGVLKDKAQELITKVIPEKSHEYVKNALREGIKDAYRLGLTGAHTEDLFYYHGFEGTQTVFKEVIEEEGHLFRAHLLVHHRVFDEMVKSGNTYQSGGDWVEFGAMKIFADGAFGGRTAFLSRPYADDPSTQGVSIFTMEQLEELIKKARENNMPVAVHAIGDAAFDMVLQMIEKHPLKGYGRDRLIHATMLREDLINRMKGLPLILDIQPSFVTSDFPWVYDRLGKDNMKYCYAWKTLLKSGLHCAGGSDAPIESADPLAGIYAAVTRTNTEDLSGAGYMPEQALSVYEAVSLYTKGSAYAICHEKDRGVIEKGFLADFTVLDQDLFTIEPKDIQKVQVVQTIIASETVYQKEERD
ncbi:amidohydrolase [Niallia taxi]|uniref:amidohydrolase n=1 Tax=Niallia taxi TaxID=2499688 RepID=UPI003981EDAE